MLAGEARRARRGARWLRGKRRGDSILPRRAREFAAMMAGRTRMSDRDDRRDHPFETELADRGHDEPALVVDVEGFEGPLDLLLTLARQQKVDLAKISILALAEQYLAFIEEARKLRLELAADYLVMAAWLAYLKSRLLLPEPAAPDGPSAEDMANALAWRLQAARGVPRGRRAS